MTTKYYIDGSFQTFSKPNPEDTTKPIIHEICGFGCAVINPDGSITELKGASEFETHSHNITSELQACYAALNHAITNNIKDIKIYHDLEGTSRWALGSWKTNNNETKQYAQDVHDMQQQYGLNIQFEKVKGHSGVKYNELADSLADQAVQEYVAKHNIIPTFKVPQDAFMAVLKMDEE
ncbi:hypothetical protein HMPREF0433_01373 [Gemella sanguinis M325]|jgi:ribonuclease H|uniref:Reverse transcriptase-like protein n=1 Tax=Gemella sanguinis TaxID=84135 RepID=A0ABX6FHD7_9BACL|nr:RNase H family protein [Gemella sanguinis]EGF86669.1 hypothetical protein HMPREF0433_01373 [Gemella sanguinis M325]QGS07164.1 reverse transcriptase-like protein [Gemella sanguinis]